MGPLTVQLLPGPMVQTSDWLTRRKMTRMERTPPSVDLVHLEWHILGLF